MRGDPAQLNLVGRVLVVDDALYVRDILGEYLRDLGYQVDVAEDAATAFARIGQAMPDLVLLDLRLPGIQGDAVFAELRRKYPSLPIVIVSANGDAQRARELIKHGAFDYVSKPWDFDYLERVVSAATIAS